MTMRLVRNEFCEFGYHNPKEPFSDVIYPRIIDSRLRNLCDRCYNLYKNNNGDWSMEILYYWVNECGSPPQLPKSLRNCSKRARLVAHINKLVHMTRDDINDEFPIFLKESTERIQFIQRLEHDSTIIQTLEDVPGGNDRKNMILRLWVGCVDAAKATRDKYNAGRGVQIAYTPEDRAKTDATVRQKAPKDPLYEAGVEAALFFELIENKHTQRYLEGISSGSLIRKYLKDNSKDKSIITVDDLLVEETT
jgi:hypothetical protein